MYLTFKKLKVDSTKGNARFQTQIQMLIQSQVTDQTYVEPYGPV